MTQDQSIIFHKNGVAIGGYDPVAYFELNEAVKGSPQVSYEWEGLDWYFSSLTHKNLFLESPEAYIPQYGGFCAFGVSNGYKASTRPNAFSIIDGKLYLNFAKYVKRRWTAKQSGHITSANSAWGNIKEDTPIKAHPIPIWWKYQFLKLVGKDLFE